jgi:hypothetical protein
MRDRSSFGRRDRRRTIRGRKRTKGSGDLFILMDRMLISRRRQRFVGIAVVVGGIGGIGIRDEVTMIAGG